MSAPIQNVYASTAPTRPHNHHTCFPAIQLRPGSRRLNVGPRTNLCFFCSTILPCVYAMSPKHPPFTHPSGWTGNILCSQQCTVVVQHQKHGGVKPKQIDHQSPVFVRPRKIKRTHRRKMNTKIRFVHACCIHSHIVYSGTRWKRSPVDQ